MRVEGAGLGESHAGMDAVVRGEIAAADDELPVGAGLYDEQGQALGVGAGIRR